MQVTHAVVGGRGTDELVPNPFEVDGEDLDAIPFASLFNDL